MYILLYVPSLKVDVVCLPRAISLYICNNQKFKLYRCFSTTATGDVSPSPPPLPPTIIIIKVLSKLIFYAPPPPTPVTTLPTTGCTGVWALAAAASHRVYTYVRNETFEVNHCVAIAEGVGGHDRCAIARVSSRYYTLRLLQIYHSFCRTSCTRYRKSSITK